MLRQIDARDGITLFKVTTPKGVSTYRTFPTELIGNADAGKDFPNLSAARATMAPIPDTTPKTKPRSVNPQNQAGFKADSYKGKK